MAGAASLAYHVSSLSPTLHLRFDILAAVFLIKKEEIKDQDGEVPASSLFH